MSESYLNDGEGEEEVTLDVMLRECRLRVDDDCCSGL